MSKNIQDYCDVCGGLLYHSILGNHFKFNHTFSWHGDKTSESEADVCGDCLRAIGYVVEHNRILVANVRSKIGNDSPHDQMAVYKPTTWRKVLNIFKASQGGEESHE